MVAQRGKIVFAEPHTPDQMSASMALILLGQAGPQEGEGKAKRAKSEQRERNASSRVATTTPPVSLSGGDDAKSHAPSADEAASCPMPESPSRQRRHTALLETLYDAAMDGTDAAWTDDGQAILFPNFEEGINRIVSRVRSRRQFKNDWATFTRNMRKMGFISMGLKKKYHVRHKFVLAHRSGLFQRGARNLLADIDYDSGERAE